MAQLPPKVPNMTTTPNWSQFHQKMPSLSSINMQSPPNAINNQNPSWVDEFLDFSSARRGAHRRSASDSVTFTESPMLHDGGRIRNGGGEFDRFDDEQFLSMFSDNLMTTTMPPPSSSNPSSPSDHNSIDDNEKESAMNKDLKEEKEMMMQQQQVKNESDEDEIHQNNDDDAGNCSGDRITDPKRVKRILANRQSAQRSRVRKLQYISELERSVTSLQAEVSVLSPRVAFLDHQRLLLNVDNSAIKQRIAALAQDKIFKDAHQEALKREIERLRQVYHNQHTKKMDIAAGSPISPSPSPSPRPRCDQTQPENEHLINV